MVLAACTSAPPNPTSAAETSTSGIPLANRYPHTEVQVGEETLTVWVADNADDRARGLMDIAVMPPGIDGMLFVFDRPIQASFWMLDTLIPLDVWWFDQEGRLLGVTTMQPCEMQPCPDYPAPAPILWALETPSGVFAFPVGVRLLP